MHLFWDMPATAAPIVEVSVDLVIPHQPVAKRLMFWALQASFAERGQHIGAGHLGLQFHPDYPDGGALNWGGYHASGSTGTGELPGSALTLASTLSNPNTGNYPWKPGTTYRYRIYKSPERGWRGSMTDLDTGIETIVRDLWCPGSNLEGLIMWTESFAACDDPSVRAGWSNMRAVTSPGTQVRPHSVRVNYQKLSDGGCTTSNIKAESTDKGTMLWQVTGAQRTTTQGSVLTLDPP